MLSKPGTRNGSNTFCAGRAISVIERARSADGVQRPGYRIRFVEIATGALTPAFDQRSDEIADGQARRQPGRLDTGCLDDEWILAIAADQEIRERLGGRMDFCPDAAAAEPQILEPHVLEQPARRLEEGFDRKTMALVIVFPLLERRGRPKPDVAVRRSHQVHAKTVRMRKGIDERVDERSLRGRELDMHPHGTGKS